MGEGWAEVESWQVEESRSSGEKPPARPPHPAPPLQESLFAPQAPSSLGQRWAASVEPTVPAVFVLGDLAPRPSLPRTLARCRLSMPGALPGP